MNGEKLYNTKYGIFYDELTEDDIKFFEMTDEELDERTNRLANKALNNIRDKEIIEADERAFRNLELLYGKKYADLKRKLLMELFGY